MVERYLQATAVIAESETLEAVHGKAMRKVHTEALAIDDLLGGLLILWLHFILALWTFGDDELMTALMNNTGAH
jgi:hypothetical protein